MHHDLPRHGIILIPSSHIAAVSQYWTLTHTSSYVRIVHGLRPIVYLQQYLLTMLLIVFPFFCERISSGTEIIMRGETVGGKNIQLRSVAPLLAPRCMKHPARYTWVLTPISNSTLCKSTTSTLPLLVMLVASL